MMKMFDADRTQILNASQFLRGRGYSLVDSDEYSIDLSDEVHTFAIAYDRYYDDASGSVKFIKEDDDFVCHHYDDNGLCSSFATEQFELYIGHHALSEIL